MIEVKCYSCGAIWSDDKYTNQCEECGGGALTRPCPVCEGLCGATWQKAVLDSNDSGIAHWIGKCNFPYKKQLEIMRNKMQEK